MSEPGLLELWWSAYLGRGAQLVFGLLPADRPKDDQSIFLRICHSPFLSQKALTGLRGMTAGYLIATFLSFFQYDNNANDLFALFEFPVIAFGLLALYHAVAFSWTFMHLHHPHLERHEDSFVTNFYKSLSPPHQNSFNRLCFSIFYMAVNVFPWVAATIYWAVLTPQYKVKPQTPILAMPSLPNLPSFEFNSTLPIELPEHLPISDMFSNGCYIPFILLSRYLAAPLITLIEVYFFSSIRSPSPLNAHLIALAFLLSGYVGWAYYGYYLFGHSSYYFFDFASLRKEHIMSVMFCFVLFGLFVYCILDFLIAFREVATRKKSTERKPRDGGYGTLPQ